MVKVVKENIELAPGGKSRSFGDELMVGIIELPCEASKHASNSQIKLMVTIERGWVKDHYMMEGAGLRINQCS